MVHLADLPPSESAVLEKLECVPFDTQPWTTPPAQKERRIAMISSAGLLTRGDRPVPAGDNRYREIADDADANDILMSHVSVNFDRTGFMLDENVVLPRQRLHELAESGAFASVANTHYSFMGATEPRAMESNARKVAGQLKNDGVNTALLLPV